MSDGEYFVDSPASLASSSSSRNNKQMSLPIEVLIITTDHEIQGLIHVSRNAREDRRISDLLNDPSRRFLAVTDAKIVNRSGPGSPRLYRFLQLHLNSIVMIHPAVQSVSPQAEYSPEEAARFNDLRIRLTPAESDTV